MSLGDFVKGPVPTSLLYTVRSETVATRRVVARNEYFAIREAFQLWLTDAGLQFPLRVQVDGRNYELLNLMLQVREVK